jgi:Ca2+/Na+ antiporter
MNRMLKGKANKKAYKRIYNILLFSMFFCYITISMMQGIWELKEIAPIFTVYLCSGYIIYSMKENSPKVVGLVAIFLATTMQSFWISSVLMQSSGL